MRGAPGIDRYRMIRRTRPRLRLETRAHAKPARAPEKRRLRAAMTASTSMFTSNYPGVAYKPAPPRRRRRRGSDPS
jgi:hypothetical protein